MAIRLISRPQLRGSTYGWLTLLALLAVWQIATQLLRSPDLASFSASLQALWAIVSGRALVEDVLPSLAVMFAGLAVAGVFGIGAGLLIGTYRGVDPWIRPLLEFLRATPPPLIVPVAMLIFGIDQQLTFAVIAFGTVWPILINTIDGARRVEVRFLDNAAVYHVSAPAVLFRVVLPASLPAIFAGLRVALSTALIMLVLAQMLASTPGIGYLILVSQQAFEVATTFGGVLLLAILGWALDALLLAVQARLLRWHSGFQGAANV